MSRKNPTASDEPTGPDPDLAEKAPSEGEALDDFFNTNEIFKRVLATAEDELERPFSTFFWGALAAGLVIGFSFLARVVVTAALPGEGNELVGNLLYPVGFIFVILGRYPLYTENTLTPVVLALTRFASLRDLLQIWGVSLCANLLGALLFALLLANTGILVGDQIEVAKSYGEHLVNADWADAFFKAVLAGWLLASLVWLVHAARDTVARLILIWLVIYLQVTADLFHCIVGSVEVFYLMLTGGSSLWTYLWGFLAPSVLGNTIGGVVFVAILNYAQFNEEHISGLGERLSWREWVSGREKTA